MTETRPRIETRQLETQLVHAGDTKNRFEGAKVTPIVRSTVFEAGEGELPGDIRYPRLSTLAGQTEIGAVMASIECGEAGLVTSSGMAAITTTLLAVLAGGGHLLAARGLYGATHQFIGTELPKLGASSSWLDLRRPATWSDSLTAQTRAIYVESITNPLLDVAPHRAVVAFAREHRLTSIVDNTFASPVNFRPLELGYDVVLHSATKYLNGHSDVCAGVVVTNSALFAEIKHWLILLGGNADPEACFLLRRGLRTLAVRVERQNENARRLAEFLEAEQAVRDVRYPGLPSHPDHAIARELFDGFGGMIACELQGGAPAAERFVGALQIATHSASLGGTETLVTIPARTSHAKLTPAERQLQGVGDGLLRISTGIEHIDDLRADFAQALAQALP